MTVQDSTYDVIGIGFGPAGISLAAAIDDAREDGSLDIDISLLFIEKAPNSAWQPNTLLHGTDIQHHFLRDFATPRNPRSRFTFPNYLKNQDRLFDFGLFGGGAVSRIEWSDYVEWVASEVNSRALYGHEVVTVRPVATNGAVPAVMLEVQDRATHAVSEIVARNIVVSTGHVPYVPEIFREFLGDRVFHAHYFKERISAFNAQEVPSFAVIGSGQNAAEIVLYLATHFPDSEIYWLIRNSGPRLLDRGNFSQQVYLPGEADYVYRLDKWNRQRVFDEVRHTNYGAIDPEDSLALYRRVYEEKVLGRDRIHVMRRAKLHGVQRREEAFHLMVRDVYGNDGDTDFAVDAMILCTGFNEERVPPLLSDLQPHFITDDEEDLVVSRQYKVATTPGFRPGIWLNGITEWRHGISNATSFSMMALKAQAILEDLRHTLALQPRGGPGRELKAVAGDGRVTNTLTSAETRWEREIRDSAT